MYARIAGLVSQRLSCSLLARSAYGFGRFLLYGRLPALADYADCASQPMFRRSWRTTADLWPICVRDKLLVRCNQGGSRAPSLALLFLAKCRAALSNDSYLEARSEFEKLYPGYKPGPGIQAYLRSKWHKLGAAPRQGGGLEAVRR